MDIKGCFVQGTDLIQVPQHLRENVGFDPPAPAPAPEEDFFLQYQCQGPESLALHSAASKVLTHV